MPVLKEDSPSIKNIWILISTLVAAVLLSFIFIKVIVLLELKEYLALVIPLLPVFYTIIYPILDRPFSRETGKRGRVAVSSPIEIATPSYFRNLSFWRISGAIGIALLIKFLMEISQYAMVLFLADGSLSAFWIRLDPMLILKLFKGDLVDSHISMLYLEMVLTSCAGGIWLGYSSKTKPIMEGIVAGTGLSIIIAFTNLTPLYGKINQVTSQWAGILGFHVSLELLSGILAFTFLFSCWVLIGLKLKTVQFKSKKGR